MRPVFTGLVRREGCKDARSPDSEHRTLRCSPDAPVLTGLKRREVAKPPHTRRTPPVLQSDALSLSQATPDARTGNTLRPVLNLNRAKHWQHTGRSGQRSVPPRFASGECLPWLLQISHRRNRKYTLIFHKSDESRLASSAGGREEPKPLSTLGTPPPLQKC